jgi:hypothetical protein
MFNLKAHNTQPGLDEKKLLLSELHSFDILPAGAGSFSIRVGDETVEAASLDECKELIREGIGELKQEIWEQWKDVDNLAELVANNNAGNPGSLDNLYFLANVKKSFMLARKFTELRRVADSIYRLFSIDITDVHPKLVREFNRENLKVRLLHKLIMTELYRIHLISRYQRFVKQAQVSGPWSNLDLPMKERVWEWEEDEEDMLLRQKSRREQVRYNPEFNKEGFYYVWQDLTRDPYRFEDIKKDSPYKSRHLLTIP